MSSNGGQASGTRNSALWGTGKRDGSRSSVLWGKGGRTGLLAVMAACLALGAPWAAESAPPPPPPPSHSNVFITGALAAEIQANPQGFYSVIIQGDGTGSASHVAHQVADDAAQANQGLAQAAQQADAALVQGQQNATQMAQNVVQAERAASAAQGHASAAAITASQAQNAYVAAQVAAIAANAAAAKADANALALDAAAKIAHSGTNQVAAHLADAAAHQADDAAHTADDTAKNAANAVKDLGQKAAAALQQAMAAQTNANSARSAVTQAQQAAAAAQAAIASLKAADDAANAALKQLSNQILDKQVTDRFSSITGIAATLSGTQITALLNSPQGGIQSITPNAAMVVTNPAPLNTPAPTVAPTVAPNVATSLTTTAATTNGNGNGNPAFSSSQIWPFESQSANNWPHRGNATTVLASKTPAIAIIDSGIQPRSDFGSRLIASVNLGTLPDSSAGDSYGHGTFVAGVAADELPGITGADPVANLVDVQVMDANGSARTSDVINACQWVLDHAARYNIRVVNLSLQSGIVAPFYLDPVDQAVEQLWFHGIVVVAAAGNYGSSAGPSGVLFSPANDPFVITVGAADTNGSTSPSMATVAPWSAWGSTIDGFGKPEISAPGRYMIAPVPSDSTLASEFPSRVTSPGYMQLSGTSFAAPVVSGAAANILAAHPDWTPDQVKGALMLTASPFAAGVGLAGGVGTIQASDAAAVSAPPNPNAALDAFIVTSSTGSSSGISFNNASWNSAATANASWNSASWNSASWNSASWNSASWNSASWNSASWNSASWNSASWNSASWNSASWNSVSTSLNTLGDVAEGSATPTQPLLKAANVAVLLANPGFDPSTLPSWLLPGTTH